MVENDEMKRADVMAWSVHGGEDGIPRELLRVRTLLAGLPHLSCPTGFEFRLQRRIEGGVVGGMAGGRVRSWTLSWAGAGLGVATAFIIAVFVFNLNTVTPPMQSPMASSNITAPASELGSQPGSVENPAQTVNQLASDATEATETANDSQAVSSPTDLPENLYHTVGGNQR